MTSRIVFLLLLSLVGSIYADFKPEREFEVKQASLLNNGRSYTYVSAYRETWPSRLRFRITELGKPALKEDPRRFTIDNEMFRLAKKLVLSENGRPLYQLKHKLGHLYQKYASEEATSTLTSLSLSDGTSMMLKVVIPSERWNIVLHWSVILTNWSRRNSVTSVSRETSAVEHSRSRKMVTKSAFTAVLQISFYSLRFHLGSGNPQETFSSAWYLQRKDRS